MFSFVRGKYVVFDVEWEEGRGQTQTSVFSPLNFTSSRV